MSADRYFGSVQCSPGIRASIEWRNAQEEACARSVGSFGRLAKKLLAIGGIAACMASSADFTSLPELLPRMWLAVVIISVCACSAAVMSCCQYWLDACKSKRSNSDCTASKSAGWLAPRSFCAAAA